VETLSLTSYAKVNLGLHVLAKRADGFHDIETILQTIDLRDRIRITPLEEKRIEVRCDRPEVPSGPENLVHRAAQLILSEHEVPGGCRIEIDKRIPAGAGLGGGSGNAAVTLLGLNRLWDLNMSREDHLRMAARLGSDVPFFLEGGTALAEGRGERLTPLRLVPDFWLVLVKPAISISTAWAYGRVKIPLTLNSKFV
jgi:4-diphosphocytidyl-2-C-methyl-D-erythritol kinase